MKLQNLVWGVLLAGLTGCSMQKMAGDAVIEYTHDVAIPYLMAQGDLESACQMGQAMGPLVSSFSRVELEPEQIGIATQMASGMCAEMNQREAELERGRALYENRTAAAQDATIREKQAHRLAALRMIAAYDNAMATYGDMSARCPKFDNTTDELLSLLGLASGALALLHDFNSEKSVEISLDVPVQIEKSASCFDDARWWGMPTALRASLWLSIPGAGPEGVDPLQAMEEAARTGDKQGVLLARAMLVMMAGTVGRHDVLCRALEEIPSRDSLDADYAMLNAYAMGLMTHQADLAWTKERGYRAPFLRPSCPVASQTSMDADKVEDLLDGLFEDETSEAPVEDVPATDAEAATEQP